MRDFLRDKYIPQNFLKITDTPTNDSVKLAAKKAGSTWLKEIQNNKVKKTHITSLKSRVNQLQQNLRETKVWTSSTRRVPRRPRRPLFSPSLSCAICIRIVSLKSRRKAVIITIHRPQFATLTASQGAARKKNRSRPTKQMSCERFE